MVDEILVVFKEVDIRVFYDGTIGAGGHAKAILEAHPEIKRYFACDKDPQAIEIAREVLKPWKDKVVFIQGDFADLDLHMKEKDVKEVNGFFLT